MINFKSAVVIAPHPDDEVLGVGGALSRLVEAGARVSVLFVSGHLPPLYEKTVFEKTKQECKAAMKALGVKDYSFLEIPATLVSDQPVAKLNASISDFITNRTPDVVFVPFPDRHIDHRIIFDSSLVACRPVSEESPICVLAYETLSETYWNAPGVEPYFIPEFFIDISAQINKKIEALNYYESQITSVPSRSKEAVLALAKFRGSQNGCEFAEAFKVIRIILK